jgi:hypothetical protein
VNPQYIDEQEMWRLLSGNLGPHQAPSPVTVAELRSAVEAAYDGGWPRPGSPRPVVEVTQEEFDALTHVEPAAWPSIYGLPADFGGVRVVVVGVADARRRQGELEEML